MKPVWLTVDSDDLRHTPKSQGHPTRSKGVIHEGTSEEMRVAMVNFVTGWIELKFSTIFVIADQLMTLNSRMVARLLNAHPQVTIGCHGLTHRCWSAYPEDPEGLLKA